MNLDTPLTELEWIPPQRVRQLERFGIATVGALLTTVVLFAVVLVSGSQAMVGGSVPNSAQKLGATKVTTVSLNGWVGAKVEDDLLKQVIAAFEKSHPAIKVDYSGPDPVNTTHPWRCVMNNSNGARRAVLDLHRQQRRPCGAQRDTPGARNTRCTAAINCSRSIGLVR